MKQTFADLFKQIDSKLHSIRCLSLTTEDGFSVFSQTAGSFKVEDDKLSAVTSSLTALGSAAAKQLIGAKFESTCIETNEGLMFMIKTKYQDKPCVLSLISGNDPNLGQIRFYLNKLAAYLETAKLSAANDSQPQK
ncbi:roadblock/LC7 domain-containing protein [Marinicella meishanensis]|uniref:roadblock/LC7 domain-containing protein n=1 Tax=Marinicella meishanensis TaxID=2873263 RepID=UPI001CBC9DA4|nr:hypothetical protein [Marinicella sp. NBU2979]